MRIAVIDYGAGNVRSVELALNRLGANPVITNNPDEILNADRVIFPGVGHADAAKRALNGFNLTHLIPTLKQPVLGVCLGMQLMCLSSEEGNTEGLGIFNCVVKRFDPGLKIPHMGWNTSESDNGSANCYFVHSYYAPICDDTLETCDYGIEFSAALQRHNFLGVQYHPEKSGKAGEALLKRFLER